MCKVNPMNKILENSQEIAINFSELTLDQYIKSGALKDVPIISTALSTVKFANSINDYFFTKKLVTFLNELKVGSFENLVNELRCKVYSDDAYKKKVIESILVILDKSEDCLKAEINGKLTDAFLSGRISLTLFLFYTSIVNQMLHIDLKTLHQLNSMYKEIIKNIRDPEGLNKNIRDKTEFILPKDLSMEYELVLIVGSLQRLYHFGLLEKISSVEGIDGNDESSLFKIGTKGVELCNICMYKGIFEKYFV